MEQTENYYTGLRKRHGNRFRNRDDLSNTGKKPPMRPDIFP